LQFTLHLLDLILELLGVFVETLADLLASGRPKKLRMFVNEFFLNLEGKGIVIQYCANDRMGGFDGFRVTKGLGSFIDSGFEEHGRQLSFSSLTDFETDSSPHIRHDHNVLQRLVPAEFPEHTEVSDVNSCEPFVRDAMEVDYACESDSLLVPCNRVSVNRERQWKRILDVRPLQKSRNQPRNLGTTHLCIIETRGVNQHHPAPVEGEQFGGLNTGSTRNKVGPHFEIFGPACEVCKLSKRQAK
jgi:hypothetical protein